jgi:hypothetical protein
MEQFITSYEGPDDDMYRAFESFMAEERDDYAVPTCSSPKLSVDDPKEEQDDATYYTASYITNISSENATILVQELANRSLLYRLLPDAAKETTPRTARYDSSKFYGVMIDTGAAKRSTAGLGQFEALQALNRALCIDRSTEGAVTVQFGIGSSSSVGSAVVPTPIGNIEFYITKTDTPFLLSLADMDEKKVYLNNLRNVLVTPEGDIPIVRRFGHPFLL